MEKVKITFLGTGNAIPTKKRNHTGILVNFANETILFDCGEGIQRQFRNIKIKPTRLTNLFITHWHGDHILGIPGMLQTLAMSNYQKTLNIYGPVGTKHYLNLIKELLKYINIKFKVFEVQQGICIDTPTFSIGSLPMIHDIPTLAYSITIKDKIRINKEKLKKLKIPNSPLLGDLQKGKDIVLNGKKISASSLTYKEKGKKITIILDTLFNKNAIQLAKNSDLLICESTYACQDEEKAKEYKHLTASQAATIAKKAKVKSLILTHISQRYEPSFSIIEKEAKEIFKNTKIAKDFEEIIL